MLNNNSEIEYLYFDSNKMKLLNLVKNKQTHFHFHIFQNAKVSETEF